MVCARCLPLLRLHLAAYLVLPVAVAIRGDAANDANVDFARGIMPTTTTFWNSAQDTSIGVGQTEMFGEAEDTNTSTTTRRPSLRQALGLASLLQGFPSWRDCLVCAFLLATFAIISCFRTPRSPAVTRPDTERESQAVSDSPPCALATRWDELRVHPWLDVEAELGQDDSYDCALSRPAIRRGPLLLKARVIEPCSHAGSSQCPPLLTAPLSRKECIVYAASVCCREHHQLPPVTLAFASEAIDFVVAPLDAPHVRIHLCGHDVSLFRLGEGATSQRCVLMDAPEHWQTFATSESQGVAARTWANWNGRTSLDFHEAALLPGVELTFVGELHRTAEGQLWLRPLSAPASPQLTSWESFPMVGEPTDASPTHGRVLVSDDAQLLLRGGAGTADS